MHVLPPTPNTITTALSLLEEGGIIAHATETCYGLACDLTNPTAVAHLFRLKRRPIDQPVSALFSSIEQTKQYVLWNTQAETLAKKYLPGPFTVILPLRTDAPHQLHPTPPRTSGLAFLPARQGPRTEHRFSESRSPNPEVRTLGIRISSHPLAQELVAGFGKPISTTSANLHGQPTTYSLKEILSQFPDNAPDVFLIDSGSLSRVPPSTIIDATETPPREVRRGAR